MHKRNSSNISDKSKRSFDEIRLSNSSRTPSERSMTTPGDKQNIIPTPELLAELLKGSSERMVSEQRQNSVSMLGGNFSLSLPTAVLRCLVSQNLYLFLHY